MLYCETHGDKCFSWVEDKILGFCCLLYSFLLLACSAMFPRHIQNPHYTVITAMMHVTVVWKWLIFSFPFSAAILVRHFWYIGFKNNHIHHWNAFFAQCLGLLLLCYVFSSERNQTNNAEKQLLQDVHNFWSPSLTETSTEVWPAWDVDCFWP